MARTLNGTLENLFRGFNYARCYPDIGQSLNPTVKYMEIPISENRFEVPIFAMDGFNKAIRSNRNIEALTVILNSTGYHSGYVTLDRNMIDVLLERFSRSRLALVNVKDKNNVLTYYGTQGAIFDKDLNPVMMCSFLMEKNQEGNYRCVRPILRIKPQVYMNKANPMERYIVNKIAPTCLSNSVLANGTTRSVPKVEIDECPFVIRTSDVPNASTTNKELLQIAINHVDEIINDSI